MAEVVDLPATLFDQLHQCWFLRCFRQNLNQQPAAVVQPLTADPLANKNT